MKFKPGDEVVVKSKEGEGRGRVIGHDDETGTFRVHFDELKHVDGQQTFKDLQGYAAPKQMRRA